MQWVSLHPYSGWHPLWRGDLSPLGCVAAPLHKQSIQSAWHTGLLAYRVASRPSGDKSPRHRESCLHGRILAGIKKAPRKVLFCSRAA
ncbi:hypothetical protein EGM97_04730 [Pseudomonas sp. AF32]|nr:hypothetical protein [Pseudomonas sp. AF32]